MTYRTLTVDDAVAVQQAVNACPPLTLHTPYTYWVILSRSELCVGAWQQQNLIGFVLPISMRPRGVFVWQIGVLPDHRGLGIGRSLLDHLWNSGEEVAPGPLGMTIAAGNDLSLAVFASFARHKGLSLEETGESVCRDPAGNVVEREIEYRLESDD